MPDRISQQRVRDADACEFRISCSERDWELMGRLQANSVPLRTVTDRWRGDEMSADGLVWQCPNCGGYTVPGTKRKGGGYEGKICPMCSLRLDEDNIRSFNVVSDERLNGAVEPYVDGSSLQHRYGELVRRWVQTDLNPFVPGFKNREIFEGTKILIRQAGVGITATLLTAYTRCPQSVYIYKCSEEGRKLGYTEHFILASLASRTMNYFLPGC